MADVLGDPQSAATPSQQQTSSAIASMSPKQLYQILKDLKSHIEADPQKGRDVLRQNLVLTKALFQAQILLGMLNPDATAEAPAAAEEAKPAAEPAPNGGPAVVAPAPQPAPANQQGAQPARFAAWRTCTSRPSTSDAWRVATVLERVPLQQRVRHRQTEQLLRCAGNRRRALQPYAVRTYSVLIARAIVQICCAGSWR